MLEAKKEHQQAEQQQQQQQRLRGAFMQQVLPQVLQAALRQRQAAQAEAATPVGYHQHQQQRHGGIRQIGEMKVQETKTVGMRMTKTFDSESGESRMQASPIQAVTERALPVIQMPGGQVGVVTGSQEVDTNGDGEANAKALEVQRLPKQVESQIEDAMLERAQTEASTQTA
jgi:hypothetical protein